MSNENSFMDLERLSQKSTGISLEYFCSNCLKILVDPLICSKCKEAVCKMCLLKTKNKTVCLCEQANAQNFSTSTYLNENLQQIEFKYDIQLNNMKRRVNAGYLSVIEGQVDTMIQNVTNQMRFPQIVHGKKGVRRKMKNHDDMKNKLEVHTKEWKAPKINFSFMKILKFVKKASFISFDRKMLSLIDFPILQAFFPLPKMWKISFDKSFFVSDFALKFTLHYIVNNYSLTKFEFNSFTIGKKPLSVIFKGLMKCPNITYFSFRYCKIESNFLNKVVCPFFLRLKNLTTIILKAPKSIGEISSMKTPFSFPFLKELNISQIYFKAHHFELICSKLEESKFLEKLDLSDISTPIEVINFSFETFLITTRSLQILNINDCNIELSKALLSLFVGLKYSNTIKILYSQRVDFPKKIIKLFLEFLLTTQILKEFYFQSKNISLFSNVIQSLVYNNSIKILNFNHQVINDNDCQFLNALISSSIALEELSLRACTITYEGLKSICINICQSKSLKSIYLDYIELKGRIFPHLANSIKDCKTLTCITLEQTKLYPTIIAQINQLLQEKIKDLNYFTKKEKDSNDKNKCSGGVKEIIKNDISSNLLKQEVKDFNIEEKEEEEEEDKKEDKKIINESANEINSTFPTKMINEPITIISKEEDKSNFSKIEHNSNDVVKESISKQKLSPSPKKNIPVVGINLLK